VVHAERVNETVLESIPTGCCGCISWLPGLDQVELNAFHVLNTGMDNGSHGLLGPENMYDIILLGTPMVSDSPLLFCRNPSCSHKLERVYRYVSSPSRTILSVVDENEMNEDLCIRLVCEC
jgi:hypothetical protein